MPPEIPLEIWLAAIPWGHADYPRPVIFMGHRPKDRLVALRVSSNLDLMKGSDFLISDRHPDFRQTNLDSTSYVRAEMIELAPQDFLRRLGLLAGALREDFEAWLQGGA